MKRVITALTVFHRPTEAEFAPNPNSEGSMLIYTGNIGSKLASGELFAYAEVLQVMKVLWEEVSPHQARVAEAVLAERQSVAADGAPVTMRDNFGAFGQ
jgi:hypothetical protein